MPLSKKDRLLVYKKLDGHCGYCGKSLQFKEMQVDHMNPKCHKNLNSLFEGGVMVDKTDCIENLMPTCRRCNHYKRASTVEVFRQKMKTLHHRLSGLYTHKVALDYGIVIIKPFDGVFYFEKLANE